MPFYVYILQSEVKETYYIGSSENPEKRLFYHNNQSRKAYTKRHRPWKLVFRQCCTSKAEALKLEQKIKGWKSKLMIRNVIEGKIQI